MPRKYNNRYNYTSPTSSSSSSYFPFISDTGFSGQRTSNLYSGGRHTACENRILRLEETTTKIQRDINKIVNILSSKKIAQAAASPPPPPEHCTTRRPSINAVTAPAAGNDVREKTRRVSLKRNNDGVLVLIPTESMIQKMPKHVVLGQPMPCNGTDQREQKESVIVSPPSPAEGRGQAVDGCIHQCPVQVQVAPTKLGKASMKPKKKKKAKHKKKKHRGRRKVWLLNS